MSIRVEASVTIDRPPADVFAVLTDVPHHPDWAKDAGKILTVSENPAILGTTWTQISKIVGRELEIHAKVNAYEVNRTWGFQADKPIPMQMRFLLEAIGSGTKVTQIVEGEPGRFFGIAAPLLKKTLRDSVSGGLGTLKAQLEARA